MLAVVQPAEPANQKWFSVIVMVSFGFRIAALLAGLANQLSYFNRISAALAAALTLGALGFTIPL